MSLDEAAMILSRGDSSFSMQICTKNGLDYAWSSTYNRFAVVETSGNSVTNILFPEEMVADFQSMGASAFFSAANLVSTKTLATASTAKMDAFFDLIDDANGAPVTIQASSSSDIASLAEMSSSYDQNGVGFPGVDYETDFTNVTIELTNDIYLGGTQWTPFGESSKKPFQGIINGNGHTIYGLTNTGYEGGYSFTTATTRTTGSAYGLISYASGNVVIQNLNMESVAINMVNPEAPTDAANGLCVGALVGYVQTTPANSTLTIENCTVSGSLRGVNDIGGFVGKFYGKTLTMRNCTNNAAINVELSGKAVKGGGLVGYLGTNGDAATIENFFYDCTNNGAVTITSRDGYTTFAGGLYGGRSNYGGGVYVKNFVNNGAITTVTSANDNYAGQIVGQMYVASTHDSFILEGNIVLNGSSTAFLDPSAEPAIGTNYYITAINVAFEGDVMFGYLRGGTFTNYSFTDKVCFVAGTTINGTALTEAAVWSCAKACSCSSGTYNDFGAQSYTFKLAA